ncbi:hypothetical protein F7725_002607 [Dissostichus mawsoni]|uniref:G-protein coupled receptors family 1 profile domain-containing protein n=1 Tax=Dissostichus mawsoni TaxID=36200 RepID=A0A7J5Y5Z8_DISMA|nr:hypothetical protein F7725_002607 [Dissostichus mawsoni]
MVENTGEKLHRPVYPTLVLISFSCFFTFDVIIVRLGFNIPVTTRLILTLQVISYNPLFNPIIYGLKMKKIFHQLKMLNNGQIQVFVFFIMFTVYILTICFNFTIMCLIWKHMNPHEPMYFFIAALLLNSIIYNTAMYPKLLGNFVSEKPVISYSACLSSYYTLSASDFFLFSAMAYDRYVSICKPLQYHTIMRTTTVSVILSLAWLVPACQVAVSVILVINTKFCHFT